MFTCIFQTSLIDSPNQELYGHPVPLTAYVLIALYKIETDVSGVSWWFKICFSYSTIFTVCIETDTWTNIVDPDSMDHVKQKSAFEHEPNTQIQIILRMPQVSLGPLLPIHTFYSMRVSQ